LIAGPAARASATGLLYWVDSTDGKILRANADGTAMTILPTSGLVEPTGLAIDVLAGHMYVSDFGIGCCNTDRIVRVNLDGSGLVDIVSGIGNINPSSVAIDVVGERIYWGDMGTDGIMRADFDGSNVAQLITGLNSVRDVALDLSAGFIYFAQGTSVRRVNLDGSGLTDLVTQTDLPGLAPYSLELDLASGSIYFADAGTDGIYRSDLDGSNLTALVSSGLFSPDGVALDLVAGHIYWTDTGFDRIQRSNLDGSNVTTLITGLTSPTSLVFLAPEPTTALLLAGGLAGLAAAGRRRSLH